MTNDVPWPGRVLSAFREHDELQNEWLILDRRFRLGDPGAQRENSVALTQVENDLAGLRQEMREHGVKVSCMPELLWLLEHLGKPGEPTLGCDGHVVGDGHVHANPVQVLAARRGRHQASGQRRGDDAAGEDVTAPGRA